MKIDFEPNHLTKTLDVFREEAIYLLQFGFFFSVPHNSERQKILITLLSLYKSKLLQSIKSPPSPPLPPFGHVRGVRLYNAFLAASDVNKGRFYIETLLQC